MRKTFQAIKKRALFDLSWFDHFDLRYTWDAQLLLLVHDTRRVGHLNGNQAVAKIQAGKSHEVWNPVKARETAKKFADDEANGNLDPDDAEEAANADEDGEDPVGNDGVDDAVSFVGDPDVLEEDSFLFCIAENSIFMDQ